MTSYRAVRRCMLVVAVLCVAFPVQAAIELIPVVSDGFNSPVFVGNAGDATDRLFIVQQDGVVRVLQPSPDPSVPSSPLSRRCLR